MRNSDARLDDADKAELEEQRRLRKRVKELEEEIEKIPEAVHGVLGEGDG